MLVKTGKGRAIPPAPKAEEGAPARPTEAETQGLLPAHEVARWKDGPERPPSVHSEAAASGKRHRRFPPPPSPFGTLATTVSQINKLHS